MQFSVLGKPILPNGVALRLQTQTRLFRWVERYLNMINLVYFDVGGVLNRYDKVFTDAPNKSGDLFGKYGDELTRGKLDTKDFWNLCVREFDIKDGENFNMVESCQRKWSTLTPGNI